MISTQSLASLPSINALKKLTQSIAMLDALFNPDTENRYHSFDAEWNTKQMLAAMDNGSGDHYFIVFDEQVGAVIKGYAHESQIARYSVETSSFWPGVIDQLPATFKSVLAEPAFSIEDTTFCIWRTKFDTTWTIGEILFLAEDDPDGSEDLLFILDGQPTTYKEWAEHNYEQEVSLELVRHIYSHKFLSDAFLSNFHIASTYDEVHEDIIRIGYPREV